MTFRSLNNLAHLCRGHHTIKGETDWTVTQTGDGTGAMTWTGPSGRQYVTYPSDAFTGHGTTPHTALTGQNTLHWPKAAGGHKRRKKRIAPTKPNSPTNPDTTDPKNGLAA